MRRMGPKSTYAVVPQNDDQPGNPTTKPASQAPAAALHTESIKSSLLRFHTPVRRRRHKSVWTWKTVGLEQSPDYLVDNTFIKQFYRPELSMAQAFSSLFAIHNESGNIWSHLIGFFLAVFLIVRFALLDAPKAENHQIYQAKHQAFSQNSLHAGISPAPKWPMILFQCGGAYLLIVSACCHLLCCMSRRIYTLAWKIDYASIAISQATSFYPICLYAFGCEHQAWSTFYLVSSGCLAVACVFACFLDFFQHPRFALAKAGLFASLPGWGLVPIFQIAWLYGGLPPVRRALLLFAASSITTLSGSGLYLIRFPERFFPGKLDLVGNSHQVFHVCIVSAFVLYVMSFEQLWEWRSLQYDCPVH